MNPRRQTLRTDHNQGLWSVLPALLAIILIPAVCVLWFMNAAIKNQQLAVRQQLTEVYRQQADECQKAIDQHFEHLLSQARNTKNLSSAEAFVQLTNLPGINAAIIRSTNTRPGYPLSSPPAPAQTLTPSPAFIKAKDLEFAQYKPHEAAAAYLSAAEQTDDLHLKAQALQGCIRCLFKTGDTEQTLLTCRQFMDNPQLAELRDENNRLIVANIHLLAIDAAGGLQTPVGKTYADDLAGKLNDYTNYPITSQQRLFLMQALCERGYDILSFPTLSGEQLAQRYLHSGMTLPAKPNTFTSTNLDNIMHTSVDDGSTILLAHTSVLKDFILNLANSNFTAGGASVSILHPPHLANNIQPFLQLPPLKFTPDWQLAVYLDKDPFTDVADRQNLTYLWFGSTTIFILICLTWFITHRINRQIQLARLKNDLIATVSHELKTPLASMHVLTETLLDGRCSDEQAKDYFKLIAKENQRLSRLIDNFLTFSRMERNRQVFNHELLDLNDIAKTAVEAVAERFNTPEAQLNIEYSNNPLHIYGDFDALVTVAVNLLDNAWKYSGDDKSVSIKTFAKDNQHLLQVTDNGIGMTRRTTRRIFDRFYRADDTLARTVEGCGLGLSIVKFITDAHNATITVDSEPNRGTRFIVRFTPGNTQSCHNNGNKYA